MPSALTASTIPGTDAEASATGAARQIRSDNGSEFASRAVDQWAYEQGLQWQMIQPRRPMENGYVEMGAGHPIFYMLNWSTFTPPLTTSSRNR